MFKRSSTSLNSEFSFTLTGCLSMAKQPSLIYNERVGGDKK